MVPLIDKQLTTDSLLFNAVSAIESSYRRMVVVLSPEGKVLGTLTDGDVRRCILSGGGLNTPVMKAMNANPAVIQEGQSSGYIVDQMKKRNVLALPVVDMNGIFKEIIHLSDLHQEENKDSSFSEGIFEFAVIMAGGEGARLRPLTKTIPKPMVEIGGVPILERQIGTLVKAGLKRVYISVNYLSHVIEDYFKDGAHIGIEIRYIREQEKLGTAGALALLPAKPSKPIIVMNGDILTTSNLHAFYSFHQACKSLLTVAAVDYRVSIPYGVLRSEGMYVKSLEEKPSQQFLCNAGIYAISPEVFPMSKGTVYMNMTDVIDDLIAENKPVGVFPLHEYWSDIGTPDDLDKARSFFS